MQLSILNTVHFKVKTSFWACLVIAFLIGLPAYSQNTKGDKPARQMPRLVQKSKQKKTKVKSVTKDISGRRLRTKNKSSAGRAIASNSSSYKRRRSSGGDRPAKPIRGGSNRVRSSTAQAARNNVYPNRGPYVNNPSRKPKDTQHSYSNRSTVKRAARLGSKRTPPASSRRMSPRSASRSFITPGKKNVYWGKFSKGEKPYTKDISGRPLRTRNYRTPSQGLTPKVDVYKGRKRTGDRPYQGTYKSGFASASKRAERAWRGDVSGQPIRKNSTLRRLKERKLFLFGSGQQAGSPLKGSGYRTRTRPSESRPGQPIPGRQPGIGASRIEKFIGSLKGRRQDKGGGSISGQTRNNRNKPIAARIPSGGAGVGNYRGTFKRSQLRPGFSEQGIGFSGNMKGRRPERGGGSISGRIRNNGNQPLAARVPGSRAALVGAYKGFYKRNELTPGFSNQGIGFSGNIKRSRPEKGGGSISGRIRNNGNQPIPVRTPGSRAALVGGYKGFFKRGELSPGFSDQGIGFSGNIKARRQEKGGGSISGRSRNNRGNPIVGRMPPSGSARAGVYTGDIIRTSPYDRYRDQGEEFSGFQKARKPAIGGGSISGRPRNNGGNPIPVRLPPASSARAGKYSGNLKPTKIFQNQGEEFTGYIKAKRPVKGGGSISGKLWNNQGKPIDVHTPLARDAKAANNSGRIKRDYDFVQNTKASKNSLKKKEPNDKAYEVAGLQIKVRRDYNFIQNPRSAKASLKKKEPNDKAYEVAGLQVKIKSSDYDKKPHAKSGSLRGIGPNQSTVKASEFGGKMKMYWSYKHNPSSAKASMITINPNSSFAKGNEFAGRARLTKNYRHNPKSDNDALKVISPGKAYARINNFQGNLKMNKPHGNNLHPDAKFAHGYQDNVKSERTILMNVKLFWSKLFKKNDTQTTAVKEKVRRPRYDKKERELWKDLYD